MGSVSSKGLPSEGKSPRRSWRNGAGAEPRPKRGSSQPSWAAGGSTGGGGIRRWAGGVLLTAVSLALLGGFVYFVFVKPRATPLVCLHVTDYEAPLAPQAFAQEDIERFTQLFYSSGHFAGQVSTGSSKVVEPANVAHGSDFIEALVERVRNEDPGGPDNVILIYVSAQGIVDDHGRPCLLASAEPRLEKELPQAPTPSEILRPERLIDLKTLLDQLKQEHPRAWKVVFLDAVRWERNWRLGRAENLFADALAPLMTDLNPTRNSDRIVILNSCSPGEIGLADPVQERTLFGDYVASGLAGEADKSRDGRIGLVEFADYLSQRVDAAALRRGRSQRPQLILPGNPAQTIDFALARSKQRNLDERMPGGDIKQRVIDFAARWNRLPAEAETGRGIAAPLVALLEKSRQELQRHESLLLGGKAYKDVPEPTLPVSWPNEVLAPPPSVSLPLSLPASHGPLDVIESNAAGWVSRFAPPPPDQPDPLAQLRPHERLYGLWSALRQTNAAPEQLFARAGLNRTYVLPVELHTSIRFHENNLHLPARLKASAAGRFVENFLDCRQAAERAAFASGDPRVYRWIAAAVEQGDAKRREAEDLAFAGGDEGALLELLNAAQESYRAAAQTADEVARAFALRDHVLAELPYWLEWSSVGDQQRVKLGMSLIDGARELELLLDEPGDANRRDQDLAASAGRLQEVLKKLQASVAAATDNCLGSSFHLGILPKLEQLLAVPLTDPARRALLWDAYFTVLERDKAEASSATEESPVTTPRASGSALLAHWLKSRPGADAGFDALARLGRDELLKGEKDFALADEELRTRLAEADRAIRGMTPWLTLAQVRPPTGSDSAAAAADRRGRNGAVLREECARHDYYLWQAARFLEDFLGNDDGQYRALMTLLGRDSLEPYFASAAEQLLDSAAQLFPRDEHSPARMQFAARRSAAAALEKHLNQTLRPAADGPMAPDASEVRTQTQVADPALQELPPGLGALHLAGAQFDRDGTGVAVVVEPPRDLPMPPSGYFGFSIPGALAASSPPRVLPGHFKFLLPSAEPATPWKIAGYYRGHSGVLELALDKLKPGHVILAQRSPERGKLVVNSSLTDGTVVIVLDCSASMKEVNGQWMDDAIEAVRTIIGKLLETRKMEVRLVLFAHRRGIPIAISGDRVELPWNSSFGGDKETVMFEHDYQTVWKGTAVDAKLEEVFLKENGEYRIQATGYTPLYSAVRHAVLDGFADSRRGSRNLVIVTDGGDNIPLLTNAAGMPREIETMPPWISDPEYNSPPKKAQRAAAALDAIKKFGDINVSLVYLADLGGARGPVEETKRLLRIPDDQTYEVVKAVGVAAPRNVETLIARLAESVGIYPYEIVEDSGRRHAGSTAVRQEYTVHGRSTIEWDDAVRAAFEIADNETLEAKILREGKQRRVHFLGGEELESDPATQLVSLAAAEAMSLPDEKLYPLEYLLACRAEQPKVGDRHRTFHLSIRSSEPGRFTPRPREMWVEVVPAEASRDGKPPMPIADAEPYFFCQPAFVAGSPIPVVECLAPNWPTGAETAIVKVWFRMTDSREVTKLDEKGPRRPNAAGFAAGAFTFGLEFLEGRKQWAIKVTETEPRLPAAQPAWSLVTLEGSPADEVERRYFPENGRVEHYFLFRDLQKTDLGQRAVNIVPQAIWKKSATTTPKEFAVTIPRN
jgi:hypothetical protein